MAATFIAAVGGTNDGSGTTLDCSASLNVAAGDLLVAWVQHEGATTTTAVAKNSGSPANTFTFDSVNKLEHSNNDLEGAFGYVLAAAVDATATFRFTVGAARVFRKVIVMQFRPDSGEVFVKDGNGAIAEGSSSSAPNSGNFSTTGTDEIVCGGYADYSVQTTTSELINGVAATEPTGSPQGNTSAWYRILTATFTNGAASGTLGSPAEWICGGIAFKALTRPTTSTLTPADGATGVSPGTTLVAVMSENVSSGAGDWRIVKDVAPSGAPTVSQRATDNTGTGDVTSFQIDWTIPGGGTYAANDIVFIAIAKDDDDAFTSFPPTDWNTAFNSASSTTCRVAGVWRRFAAGTSTASMTVTGDSESYCARVWIISGADSTTDPYVPTVATGASAAADPPNGSAFPWGTDPSLVIAVCGGDGNGSATGFPSGYSNTGTSNSAHSTANSRSWLGYAELASDVSGAEDPSAFTNTNEEWVAATVVWRGAWTRTTQETIPAGDSQITISSATVTIVPTVGTLVAFTDYHIEADDGVVVASDDSAGWAGIQTVTTWNFTTGAAAVVTNALFFGFHPS